MRIHIQVVGTLHPDLYNFDAKTTLLNPDEIAAVEDLRSEMTALERLKLPWKANSDAEAGDWVEFNLFGGIFQLNERGQGMYIFSIITDVLSSMLSATLQIDELRARVLTMDMLQDARVEVVLDYVAAYPQDMAPPTISPSPSHLPSRNKGIASEEGLLRLPLNRCSGTDFSQFRCLIFKL
jgi:hypothetical protein